MVLARAEVLYIIIDKIHLTFDESKLGLLNRGKLDDSSLIASLIGILLAESRSGYKLIRGLIYP